MHILNVSNLLPSLGRQRWDSLVRGEGGAEGPLFISEGVQERTEAATWRWH